MTDYVDYEGDVVDGWLEDMSIPYRIYRTFLSCVVNYGTPEKATEAKWYQGVVTIQYVGLMIENTCPRARSSRCQKPPSQFEGCKPTPAFL